MKKAVHWIVNLLALAAVIAGYIFFMAAAILPDRS